MAAAAGVGLISPSGAISATKTQSFSLFLSSSHPELKRFCFQTSLRLVRLCPIISLASPHRRVFPSLSATAPFIESYREEELLGAEEEPLGAEEAQVVQKRELTPRSSSRDAGRLYVGNLPFSITSSELSEIFSQAGTVETVEIVYDRVTNRSRGFGFITMASADKANEAIRMFDGAQVGGRTLKVNFPEVPRGGEREMMGLGPRAVSIGYKDSSYKIYAGNLGWTVTSDILRDAFSACSGLVGAKVIYERDSGRSRGFGFVNFASAEDCQVALQTMDGKMVAGRPLRLSLSSEKTPSMGMPLHPSTEDLLWLPKRPSMGKKHKDERIIWHFLEAMPDIN
ncbi:33 kDa ribonucleoprotein, chloroplastic [Dendrobium catenatum]|uniref:33 kDa ribonucleoprotein, chloroplastic n=1 Tax=Dendrobium catenatum TaxID=906689 RepID=A0A2I0VCI1_9ASPA|nr:33 kDa ribonucleoprotein, chloroplastic [Dendrobium catenatum]